MVNTQGGQGALSMKLRGIFESGIKDYDDVAMKIPLDTAQRIMGTASVSKVLILLKEERYCRVHGETASIYCRPQITVNRQRLERGLDILSAGRGAFIRDLLLH